MVSSSAWSCEPSQASFPYVLLSRPLYEVKLHSKCSSVLFQVYALVRLVIFLERKHLDPVYTVHMLYFACWTSWHCKRLRTASGVKSFANPTVLRAVWTGIAGDSSRPTLPMRITFSVKVAREDMGGSLSCVCVYHSDECIMASPSECTFVAALLALHCRLICLFCCLFAM